MKKIALIALLGFCISSCTSKWEYKIVTLKSNEKEISKFNPINLQINNEELNSLGQEGWELVDVYEKTETVHPNFGDNQYVTGIQPNVRTSEINFVFKR